MRNHHSLYRSILCGILAVPAALMCLTLVSVKPAAAYGGADAQASELVRLINGERADHGLRTLRVDTFLAAKARDGAIACPSGATMSGRSKDWADYGYPSNAHLLRLCPTYSSMDAMKWWGYNTYRGEITAINGGYGTGSVTYTYGCTPSLRTCPDGSTTTYKTTAVAMGNWTSSSGHYNIMVGKYDRVGCGAWIGNNGVYFYDCLFSLGGRSTPRPAGTPKPAAPKIALVTPKPTPALSLWPDVTAMPIDTPAPTTQAAPIPAATPTKNPTLDTQFLIEPPSDAGGQGPESAPTVARDMSVAAGAGSAALSLGFWVFTDYRQRRRARRNRQSS